MADPDLQIRGEGEGGGGACHPDLHLEVRGVVSKKKNFFSALRALVWSKYKGGGPPGPSPGSAGANVCCPSTD